MTNQSTFKPQRISNNEVQHQAKLGVTRALDARKKVGIELTSEEIEQVGGGVNALLALRVPINGGRMIDIAAANGLSTLGGGLATGPALGQQTLAV